MSYQTSLGFELTDHQRTDMFASWARSDQAFFAARAAHILAFLFEELHQNESYGVRYIRPKDPELPGNHVYLTDGTWAFDFNGWTL